MILREISDTSIAISLFRCFFRWYSLLEQRINYIYHNSQTYRLIERFWEKIKICFRNSFLGRITETKQTPSGILYNSRTVQYLINYFKSWRDKINHHSRSSLTIDLVKDTKEQLIFFTVRVISIIAITMIAVNVTLSLVLQKKIGLWGWIMRGLFLFVAFLGLFCKANWQTIKRNSIILRKMDKN